VLVARSTIVVHSDELVSKVFRSVGCAIPVALEAFQCEIPTLGKGHVALLVVVVELVGIASTQDC
jgi:hypothetical protein